MLKGTLFGARRMAEIDGTDVHILAALLHLLRGDLFFALSYSPQTVDSLLEPGAELGADCGQTFLAMHPGFLLPTNASAFATAEAEYESIIDELIGAIDALGVELDTQDDDVWIEDDIDDGTENARSFLVGLRASLDGPTSALDTCGGPLGTDGSFGVGKLREEEISR